MRHLAECAGLPDRGDQCRGNPFSQHLTSPLLRVLVALLTGGSADELLGTRSFERNPHAGHERPRRPRVDRARGIGQHACGILNAEGCHRVADVVGGRDVGLVEQIPHFDVQAQRLEVIRREFGVVVDVEIDQLVARRLQQVGVVHVEGILPLDLDKRTKSPQRARHLVIADARGELVGRDARNLVPRAIEAEGRAVGQVLGVLRVDFVEISVGDGGAPAGREAPVGGELDPAVLRPRRVEHVAGIGRIGRRPLRHQFVAEELVEAGQTDFHRRVRRPVDAEIVPEVLLRVELGVVAELAVGKNEQVADLRRAVAGGHARAQQPVIVHLVEQRELWRGVLELPVGAGERGPHDTRWPGVGVNRVRALELARLPADAGNRGQRWIELQLFAGTQSVVRMLPHHIGGQAAQRGIAAGHDVARIARPAQRVVEAAEIAGGLQAEDLAAPCHIAHEVVGGVVAERRRGSGRLADVAVVEHELVAPGGLVVEVVLPPAADDGAAIVAAKPRLLGRFLAGARGAVEAVVEQRDGAASGGRRRAGRTSALERVLIELVERGPDRKTRVQIVVDDLDRETVVGRCLQGREEVDRLGVEPTVAQEAVAASVAGKQRGLEVADLGATDEIVVEIAEAASVDAIFEAVDLPARAGAEIQRAAGGVVAVERRRRTADHIDGTIGMRVDQVAAREAVRLRHREAVVKDHQVADAEAVAGVGAADRDAEITRSIALLDGNAGTAAQHIADRKRRPDVELAMIDGGLGLTGRGLVEIRGPRGDGDGLPLRGGRHRASRHRHRPPSGRRRTNLRPGHRFGTRRRRLHDDRGQRIGSGLSVGLWARQHHHRQGEPQATCRRGRG